MDPAALSSLTPEQKQAVMAQAQGQANQQIMASMVESMTVRCFDKCVGTSLTCVDQLFVHNFNFNDRDHHPHFTILNWLLVFIWHSQVLACNSFTSIGFVGGTVPVALLHLWQHDCFD
eukprot:CCRYP_013639-RB/>CCRYP_013639-RB protein AED:0.28 eAED:0.39 QI:102/0/0.66/1/0/0.33/3/697/117